MRPNSIALAMACLLAVVVFVSDVSAGSLYFDAGNSTTWDNGTSSNWGASVGAYNQPWVGDSDANFVGTAGTVNVSGTITSINSMNFSVDGYTIAGGPVTLTGSGVVTTASGTATIASQILSSVGLTKQGDGLLYLSGNNGYSGTTTINAGTFEFASADALTGYNNVTVNSGGTVAIDLSNSQWTEAGGVRIGKLVTGANLMSGSWFALDSHGTNFTYNDATSNNPGVTGQFRGPMGLEKIGDGTVNLTGTNTYTGGTKIYQGTLQAKTTAALSGYDHSTSNGGVAVYSGGTFAINVGGAGEWTVDNIGGFITYGDQWTGSQLALDTTDGDFVLNGTGNNQVRGNVGLTKLGNNKLTIATDVDYRGATLVKQGNLAVNAYNGHSSVVSVTAGAILSGYGTVLEIGGAGRVTPGDGVAGTLTTDSIDPTEGLSLAVKLAQAGSPDYANQSNSKNSLLRVAGNNPMPNGGLTAANGIDVCFDVTTLTLGEQFRGGVYVDTAPSFLDSVKNAAYQYYVLGDGNGTHSVDGASYYTLSEYNAALGISLATVAEIADFGSGNKYGGVMQFTVTAVPEPGAIAILISSLAGLVVYAWRKRT